MNRCVIYTRVSTSNQAEKEYNSCEAQRDKILSYIKSQDDLRLVGEYNDPGFTGADVNRPGLAKMLADVGRRRFDTILTYKIDRLTRSSKDFYNLIEQFEKYNVTYVSVTEHFDTGSPSGRLLRNIMLTFAQFEREMTAERTRDKMIQRAEKGLWNGGLVPFGYRRENTKLLIDESRARMVRHIFDWYVQSGSSKVVYSQALKNNFINPVTGEPVSFSTIGHILRNPVYRGLVRWGEHSYAGQHEAIVSKELFDHAQTLMKEKVRKKRTYKVFLLAGGLVKCASCGSTMSPCFTNKKEGRYHYYKCHKVMKRGASACQIKEINADKLEGFLIESLTRTSQDSQFIENLALKKAHQSGGRIGLELLEACSKTYEKQITETLQTFISELSKAPQIDRVQIIKRTIGRVNFKGNSLEVIIRLKDTSSFVDGEGSRAPLEPRAAGGRTENDESHTLIPGMGFSTSNWLPG